MSLKIYSISSADVDLEKFTPERKEDIFFILDVEIGTAREPGADLFYLTVATEAALRSRPGAKTTSKGPLLVAEYSLESLEERVKALVESCARDTWLDSVESLSQIFDYEFEDYSRNRES